MRTSLADCNILTLPTGVDGACFLFKFINIRGHECVNCTVPLWNINGTYPLHTDTYFHRCEFNGTEGVIKFEDNFGFYRAINPSHRCSSGPNSTTQFWLGASEPASFLRNSHPDFFILTPQFMDYSHGLPIWTTLKWTTLLKFCD